MFPTIPEEIPRYAQSHLTMRDKSAKRRFLGIQNVCCPYIPKTMRTSQKNPKTFAIFAKLGPEQGFLRFKSVERSKIGIKYIPTIVKNVQDSSRFVNLDNVKAKAALYREQLGLEEIKVFDVNTSKFYNVKKKQ